MAWRSWAYMMTILQFRHSASSKHLCRAMACHELKKSKTPIHTVGRARKQPTIFCRQLGSRLYLIVLGRPGPRPENPRTAPLEAALFDSGRPVLIVPPSTPQTLARNILVAWNGSTEQARTNSFAIPLLRLADKVTVLTVEGGRRPGLLVKRPPVIYARTGSKRLR